MTISIELMDHAGSDQAVANAARVSFAAKGEWNSNPEGYDDMRMEKLIGYLAKHKHLCVFRHNMITIRCKAPIFLMRQLGKHQAGLTWSEVSRRYVSTEPEFYYPEVWRAKPDGSIKQGSSSEGVKRPIDIFNVSAPVQDHVVAFIEDAVELYNKMLEAKVAPELARSVLPQSMVSEWVWTGNILAFAHVYRERIASGAQEEAKIFARQLDEVIRPLFPASWTALVD